MKLHFILACHNRKNATLSCIRSVTKSCSAADIEFDITLFDDGSTDGTSKSVISEFPLTKVFQGDGSAFWAKSMAIAESEVLSRINGATTTNNFLIWLNDDITLDEDSITRLIASANTAPSPSILIGAMRDPISGATTYSGLNKRGLHPLSFRLQEPGSTLQKVQTFNGNLVMIPVSVATALNGIDGGYSHALADVDYGLRAAAKGIDNFLSPGTYGACARNSPQAPRGILTEWKKFVGPKGAGNFHSLKRILQLTSPRLWPIYFVLTYCIWITKYPFRKLMFARKLLQ